MVILFLSLDRQRGARGDFAGDVNSISRVLINHLFREDFSMRSFRWVWIVLLSLSLLGCGGGVTYPLYLKYQPSKEFSRLQQKMGSTVAMAPFVDERKEKFYIGYHIPLQGSPNYFKSDPFPLEKAVRDSLTQVLSRQGIKAVSVPDWDGKPESLNHLETDSVFMIEIKEFWSQGRATVVGTRVKTSIRLAIHLGVKREGRVYTRNVESEKEITVARSTPERVEEMVNQMLTEIFDSYFSNPY
ncbi:MAG: hypothetical protein A2156_11245 [Deltaproteobacteria bacterium RBG_16_48_10]|nr:MAG: hypothetical protein A2156_11245 [Deltaproteobacteria bacterium RBG_16_48_10]